MVMCSLSYKSTALKFKVFVKKELDKTRITLREINSIKSQHIALCWSRLVNDTDIFVLNNIVIRIPASSHVIKIIKDLAQINKIPTDYIEDHYYEILDREECGNDTIYKYLRSHKVVKNLLGSPPKKLI